MIMENNKLVFDVSPPPLPQEIILYEIFARLPVKSLYRFRCVSKFCRSLTSHPQFLAAYRRRCPVHYVFFYTSRTGKPPVIFCNSIREDLEESSDKIDTIKLINGLICLARGKQVIVRNIGTNEQLLLPQFRTHDRWEGFFVYFCYDTVSNKYKVLRTTTSARNFSIFTLGVDKSWRDFPHPKPLYQLSRSRNVCINGVLFCTNFSTSKKTDYGEIASEDEVIASFDVGRECFDIVSYPDGLLGSRYSKGHLINVKGSLAVVDVEVLESCVIAMWIKGEGLGSNQSWVEHRIQFDSPSENFFSVTCKFSFTTNRNGEIVMALARICTCTGCFVYCHNMETGKWRRIDVFGPQRHLVFDDFLVEEYVESPLLLREVSYKTLKNFILS